MQRTRDYKVAASITIKRASEMTDRGRREVAEWLHKEADALLREGQNYAANIVIRYWYKA